MPPIGALDDVEQILLTPASHPKRILPESWLWLRVLAAPEGFSSRYANVHSTPHPTMDHDGVEHYPHFPPHPPAFGYDIEATHQALEDLGVDVARVTLDPAQISRWFENHIESAWTPRKGAMCALTTLYHCVTLHALAGE
jgi:hypothetical protein